MKESDRSCPVAGCCGPVRAGYVVCRDCWRRLPLELRTRVFDAWASGDRRTWALAVKAALHWFRDQAAAARASTS